MTKYFFQGVEYASYGEACAAAKGAQIQIVRPVQEAQKAATKKARRGPRIARHCNDEGAS